ncbi:hypothetical protein [Ciceribacter sp. L1K22]|uniref:hypothetical protein n=1 Tax=Ciceribacter sp. L1K22 TaxID=2820275 RepID=UPI001FEF558B|nr:hypothetical protein [Ciceribacter sp. L1K22]
MRHNVGKSHRLRVIDDKAHGTGGRVSADINDRTGEIAVCHPRHGDQKLAIQKAPFAIPLKRGECHRTSSLFALFVDREIHRSRRSKEDEASAWINQPKMKQFDNP